VRRIEWVDALRGACAAVVAFHHARTLFRGVDAALLHAGPAWLAAARAIGARNTEAVILFFVLSGFSIRLSTEGRGLESREGLRQYFVRRARRVLPLYWLSLGLAWLVAVSVAPLPAEWLAPGTLAGNLLFLQTAVGVPGAWCLPWAGNGPLWSLSFEVFFYASYPWLVRTVRGEVRRWVVVLVVAALGIAGNALAPNPFTMFCAAGLTWYLGVDLAERWLEPAVRPSLGWTMLLCVAAGAARFGLPDGGLAFHGTWVAASAALLARLALTRRTGHGASVEARPATRRAVWRAVVWLGSVSYALYLLHVPVMRAGVVLLGPGAAGALVAFACSVGVAYAAERWAERFRMPRRGTAASAGVN
jgi:peptidoglycan/LPS O-acetylase OafA/YrhL